MTGTAWLGSPSKVLCGVCAHSGIAKAVLFAGLLAGIILASAHGLAGAQYGPLLSPPLAPQAKSQEEFDAYLMIVTESDIQSTIRNVKVFASNYPKSELLGIAYQYQMQAYQQGNDLDGVLGAGAKALELEPNNLNTLLTLASVIPNAVGGPLEAADRLQRAEIYARRGLAELVSIRIPRDLPLERWEVMRGEMEAQAHEALGHVAAKRGDIQTALREFEAAAFNNPRPRGSQFFRLGVIYARIGNTEQARKALRRATELGPEPIRDLAFGELQKLESKR